jgi:inorganic pyrophosphatase
MSYPFDWGFIPSTLTPDGDPLNVLIVHEGSTYPGALLPCRPLGVVEMDQDDKDGKRERNDRLIVIPAWHDRLGELERASELPSALRDEIEHFLSRASRSRSRTRQWPSQVSVSPSFTQSAFMAG